MRPTILALPLASMLAAASPAFAEEPAPRPTPTDTRFGHLFVAPSIGWASPMGSAEDRVKQTDFASAGPSFGLDVGFGISRSVVLDAWGGFSSLGGGDPCTGCSAKSTVIGLGAQYHLIEGTPFDPWMGFGVGWRTTSVDTPGAASTTYSGVEWGRFVVGGDYFAWPALGFGPFLEFDVGRYGSRTPGGIASGAIHSLLTIGARVVLDPLR